ncbi:MAG: HEAT repeat domain-containing protein [Myxococcaceae bacterium]|nr:HEAT repeat domain-containing protein [Myxococcaceae bacterium]
MRAPGLLVVLVASAAVAQEPSLELRKLLTTIDSPPTKAQLVERQGRDTAMALRALASSTREPLGLRRAALAALGYFDEPATRAVLSRLAQDPQPLVRKAALETLGFLLAGAKDGVLLQALGDEDPMVRRAALRSLGASRDVEVRAALARRLAVETDVETRAVLEQALARP